MTLEEQNCCKQPGLLFIISSLANIAWIFSWHYNVIPLSMGLMLLFLVCLIMINGSISGKILSRKEKIVIRLPFSIYSGWINVATIENATTLLVSLGWNGFGIVESVWTLIILLTGILIGIAAMLKNREIAYRLVLIWAHAGILAKHTTFFAVQYSRVIIAAVVCMIFFVAAGSYVLSLIGRQNARVRP